jgi:hypothetical protein
MCADSDNDEELDKIVPLGDLADSLKIPLEDDVREWRERQKDLGYTDAQLDLEEKSIAWKQRYEVPRSYEATLDYDGHVPPGFQVVGNDELTGETHYDVDVESGAPSRGCFRERLKIVGGPSINLNELVPIDFVPEPEWTGPKPRVAPDRKAGSTTNHVGFFPVSIKYPENMSTEAGGYSLEHQRIMT